MDSAVYYCCVFDGKTKTKIHSHNNGRDQGLETMADHCLENVPPHHSWFFHTLRRTTYGFLMENGYTYLVIVDSTIGNPYLLNFLRYLRDGFRKLSGNRGDLIPVIRQLIVSLESTPRSTCIEDMMTAAVAPQEGVNSPCEGSSIPLLGKSSGSGSKLDRKKMKERAIDCNRDGAMPSRTAATTPAAFRVQKSLSSGHLRATQQPTAAGRKVWIQQVKLVVAIDILICLILFAIWLFICNGFTCLGQD